MYLSFNARCPITFFLRVTDSANWTEVGGAALNLVPDRIVFGDILDSDAAKTLIECWSSTNGGLAKKYSANDAPTALMRLDSLSADKNGAPKRLIAESIHVIVWIDLEPAVESGRTVRQIIGVTGYDPKTICTHLRNCKAGLCQAWVLRSLGQWLCDQTASCRGARRDRLHGQFKVNSSLTRSAVESSDVKLVIEASVLATQQYGQRKIIRDVLGSYNKCGC